MRKRSFGKTSSVSLLVQAGFMAATLVFVAACKIPYKYSYENSTGVGITDRANDYCRRASVTQGYKFVRSVGPFTVDTPGQVETRMVLADGSGDLTVACHFDDAKRLAVIPKAQRGGNGAIGYRPADAKQARTVCERAVKGSGYVVRNVGPAEWAGSRQFRVNVEVRQSELDRNVACRFDGEPGTASVPQVTK